MALATLKLQIGNPYPQIGGLTGEEWQTTDDEYRCYTRRRMMGGQMLNNQAC